MRKDEKMQRLDGMNLFVLAMTERLARDRQADALRAVKFAYDHMIPLLPVYYISPNTRNEPAG